MSRLVRRRAKEGVPCVCGHPDHADEWVTGGGHSYGASSPCIGPTAPQLPTVCMSEAIIPRRPEPCAPDHNHEGDGDDAHSQLHRALHVRSLHCVCIQHCIKTDECVSAVHQTKRSSCAVGNTTICCTGSKLVEQALFVRISAGAGYHESGQDALVTLRDDGTELYHQH